MHLCYLYIATYICRMPATDKGSVRMLNLVITQIDCLRRASGKNLCSVLSGSCYDRNHVATERIALSRRMKDFRGQRTIRTCGSYNHRLLEALFCKYHVFFKFLEFQKSRRSLNLEHLRACGSSTILRVHEPRHEVLLLELVSASDSGHRSCTYHIAANAIPIDTLLKQYHP